MIFKKDFTGKECIGYVDSDYARDLDKHQSITGYVFTLAQAPVTCSILHSIVALSTTDVEYMAMMKVMKEAIWLQMLLNDLRIDQDLLKTNCDRMSDIYLAKN